MRADTPQRPAARPSPGSEATIYLPRHPVLTRDSFATTRTLLLALLLLLGLRLPGVAQGGTFTVRGRIVERGGGRVIAQATVTVGEAYRVLSSATGDFEIRGVRPGRYPLTVEALGYRTVHTTIVVDQDVTGTIQLDPQPIALDTLGVKLVRFTLRGRVLEAGSGRSVPYITVMIAGYGETSTSDAGGFRLNDLPRGRYALRVEGFGWLPLQQEVDIDGDRNVDLQVEPDPITERNIELQVEKLSERARSSGFRLVVIDRNEIMASRAATPADIVASRSATQVAPCPGSLVRGCFIGGSEPIVYIDDQLTHCGLDVLGHYPRAAIQRIELAGNAIRAYTTWFIERMVERRVTLGLIEPYPQKFRC